MIERQPRNIGPHIGVVKFRIFIHRLLPDGSIDPEVIDCSDLFDKHEMTSLGEISISGYDKWNCVQKVKDKLESLSGNNGKERE